MSITETYNHLLQELNRLIGRDLKGEEKHAVFQRYIYDRVPDQDMLKAIKGKKGLITVTLPEGLQLEPILKQTQKILTLMEVSDNWEQFEGLADKGKKKPDKELTDFDKILQGILEVPKPDKPQE